MKLRSRQDETERREEVREMAEALSLFGSAMRHMADRRAERVQVKPDADRRAGRSPRMRLLLAPALGAAVAIAAAIPAWTHFHEGDAAARRPAPAVQTNAETRASANDTALMNQIDSDVTQDVPDALEPLAQLSEQAAITNTAVSEKNYASQE